MKTLTKIYSVISSLSIYLISAQQVSFENINSTNAMMVIGQIQDTAPIPASGIFNLQIGNYNFAEIAVNSKTTLSTAQLGDYNYLKYDNSFQNTRVNSVITAEGNNNIIDITGSNSISDKLQIHIKGDKKTIYIRNY